MGRADVVTKQYMEDNEVFADACNFLVYGGEQRIRPEDLKTLDPFESAVPGKGKKYVQGARDQLRYVTSRTDGTAAYLILGLESQTEVHDAMPVRNMLYDAMEYTRQVRRIAARHKKKACKGW